MGHLELLGRGCGTFMWVHRGHHLRPPGLWWAPQAGLGPVVTACGWSGGVGCDLSSGEWAFFTRDLWASCCGPRVTGSTDTSLLSFQKCPPLKSLLPSTYVGKVPLLLSFPAAPSDTLGGPCP